MYFTARILSNTGSTADRRFKVTSFLFYSNNDPAFEEPIWNLNEGDRFMGYSDSWNTTSKMMNIKVPDFVSGE